MSKYTVDCFTEQYIDTKFPENSYFPDTVEEVVTIIHNCTREISGIKKVEVFINHPDGRKCIREYNLDDRSRETLEEISMICVDYDGYRTIEELKGLIDDIRDYANKSLRGEIK